MWSVSLLVVLVSSVVVVVYIFIKTLFCGGSYASGEDKCPVHWRLNNTVPQFDKEFLDQESYIAQFLIRTYDNYYGKVNIVQKTARLLSLVENPPYGLYGSHCKAIGQVLRNMYHFGNAILPHFGYMYFGAMGVNLRLSSNSDGSKIRYNKFFDEFSMRVGCLSNECDMLVQNMAKWYENMNLDYDFLQMDNKVLRTIDSIEAQLKHIDTDDFVIFNPNCQTRSISKYLRESLQRFERKVKKMNMVIGDDEQSNVFNELAKYGSVATSYYICLGYEGRLEEELKENSVVMAFRQAFNTLMRREEEREKHFLGELLEVNKQRNLSSHTRYATMTIPEGSFVNCLGQTEHLTEKKVLVTKYCGHRCQELAEKEQKRLAENGTEVSAGREPYNVSCLSCYVAVPNNLLKETVITNMTYWSMERSGWTIYLIPDHNPTPNYTAPPIGKKDIEAMLAYDIGYKRDPPPYFHVDNFIPRQHYVPPKKRQEIDWYDLAKVFGITFVVASTSMWIFFILYVYWFRMYVNIRRLLGYPL